LQDPDCESRVSSERRTLQPDTVPAIIHQSGFHVTLASASALLGCYHTGLQLGRTVFVTACASPVVYQINVSDGGVPKLPVPEARVTVEGVSGDRHNSPNIHGGPNRAVCLFSLEVIEKLRAEGHPIGPGSSGENLTLAGIEWAELKPGDRLRIGKGVRLEIVSYTAPCEHNARWFLNGDYTRISQKRHPGWSRVYGRVLTEGIIRQGDLVTLESVTRRVPH
jgi:MOSC domain-containing protein YiiM